METLPVDREPTAPQATQAGEDRLPIRLTGHQGGPVAERLIVAALARHANQGGAGADFQEHLGPLGHQGVHPLGESHRTKHLVAPVIRLSHFGTSQLAGEIAHQRPAGRRETELAQLPLESLQHRRHCLGVEGVGNRQLAGLQTGGFGVGQQQPQRRHGPCHHRVQGAVVGGHAQLGMAGQQNLDSVVGGQQRRHAPGCRQGLH